MLKLPVDAYLSVGTKDGRWSSVIRHIVVRVVVVIVQIVRTPSFDDDHSTQTMLRYTRGEDMSGFRR
jgi:hypothetical protein